MSWGHLYEDIFRDSTKKIEMLPRLVKFTIFLILTLIIFPALSVSLSISEKQGWPLDIGSTLFSSPFVDDINNNGEKEIVVVSYQNDIFVYSPQADLYTKYNNPDKSSRDTIKPLSFDVDGDGKDELVVRLSSGDVFISTGLNFPQKLPINIPSTSSSTNELSMFKEDDSIKALTAGDNSIVITSLEDESYKEISLDFSPSSISLLKDDLSQPTLIVAISRDGEVVGVDYSSKDILFRNQIGPINNSSPAIVDIDKDGSYELFTGSTDGKIYGLTGQGKNYLNFPMTIGSGFLDDGIISSPAISDMNRDGLCEIIVTTGMLQSKSGSMMIISREGEIISEYRSIDSPIVSSPIVCNLDEDEYLEVCSITYSGEFVGINYNGEVVDGLPFQLPGSLYSSTPAVDDIDGDGYNELITLSEDGMLSVYDMNVKYVESGWNMYGGNPTKDRTFKYLSTMERIELAIDDMELNPTLKWSYIDDVDYWIIEYRKASDEDYIELDRMPSSQREYDLNKLVKIGEVVVRVRGVVVDEGDRCISNELNYEPDSEFFEEYKTEITNNYPNPFSTSTTIVFTVGGICQTSKMVELAIYDLTGKMVANILKGAYFEGEYVVEWDGNSDFGEPLPSGLYFCRMICGEEVKNRRLILLRE